MEFNRIKIEPLSANIGAEVQGVDLTKLDDTTFDQIHEADEEVVKKFQHIAQNGGKHDATLISRKRLLSFQKLQHRVFSFLRQFLLLAPVCAPHQTACYMRSAGHLGWAFPAGTRC